MSTDAEIRRHELFESIQEIAVRQLVSYGINSELADQVACAINDSLVNDWAGQYITIPKDMAWRIALRDLQIYEEFDGRNHSFLAKKYGLTVRSIYDIIKRVRRHRDPNQPSLL